VAQWQHKGRWQLGYFIWATDDGMETEPMICRDRYQCRRLPRIAAIRSEIRRQKADWTPPMRHFRSRPFQAETHLALPTDRSFPRKRLSRGGRVGPLRARDPAGTMWVNGEEVSGGSDAIPVKLHYLESEGSPSSSRTSACAICGNLVTMSGTRVLSGTDLAAVLRVRAMRPECS
jgi:hypothetical protein